MRTLIAAAAAVVGLLAGCSLASAHYRADPASNFSAYYYQSPGGLGRARSVSTSGRAAYTAGALPYNRSCGAARVWRGDHCVRE